MEEKEEEKSTLSTPWSEARSMLRVDTEQHSLPRLKNQGLVLPNVSKEKKRKPYQKPTLTVEELFEATVLACTKMGGCEKPKKHS